jgi:hypothetical protein
MKKSIAIMALLALAISGKAQTKSAADSLMASMNANDKPVPVAIFKSTRLVLGQTTEMIKKNELNFQIIHRFGDIAGANGGGSTAFGIDRVADVFFGFEYGLSDNLNLNLGRSTQQQLLQLELKWALMHQMSDGSSPVAITVLGAAGVKPYQTALYPSFSSRLTYLAQAIIARKFSDGLSLQVAPTYVRTNSTLYFGAETGFAAIQASARLKLSKRAGLILDYAHPFSNYRTSANGFEDPIGIGYEVETGGHVFTINITNANAISEMNMLANSAQRFSKGQYRIGFTISRMFDFNSKK